MSFNPEKNNVQDISRTKLDKAGKFLSSYMHDASTEQEIDACVSTLNYWRSLHSYVMHIMYTTIKRRTERIGMNHAIIAQRLKRAPSIIGKLQRFEKMRLSQMQDIAGIRVIVRKVSDVYKVREGVLKNFPHKLCGESNYLNKPKDDGYRSLHIIFEAQNLKNSQYNGLKAELQIRTQLQHQWATAVEIIGLNKKSSLKSGFGDRDTREFLCLCSNLLAVREGTPINEKYHGRSEKELYESLKNMNDRLKFLDYLKGLTAAIRYQGERLKTKTESFYIILLRLDERRLSIYPFSQQNEAENQYARYEREISRDKRDWDVVLVSVNDIKHLRRAYPNYYLDLNKFIQTFEGMLEQAQR